MCPARCSIINKRVAATRSIVLLLLKGVPRWLIAPSHHSASGGSGNAVARGKSGTARVGLVSGAIATVAQCGQVECCAITN